MPIPGLLSSVNASNQRDCSFALDWRMNVDSRNDLTTQENP